MLAYPEQTPPVPRWTWLLPAALLIAFVALVFAAPAERMLGETLRFVYVHVALTRAGMFGFYFAGLLGLAIVATANERLATWTQRIVWVAYGLFLAGGLASLFAQQRSWGGINLLGEPRNRTTLAVLAVGIIVLILASWAPWARVRGLLYAALAAYTAWIIPRTPLVLHPADAAGSSTSPAIHLAFPALTALAVLFGVWLVWYWGRRTAVRRAP